MLRTEGSEGTRAAATCGRARRRRDGTRALRRTVATQSARRGFSGSRTRASRAVGAREGAGRGARTREAGARLEDEVQVRALPPRSSVQRCSFGVVDPRLTRPLAACRSSRPSRRRPRPSLDLVALGPSLVPRAGAVAAGTSHRLPPVADECKIMFLGLRFLSPRARVRESQRSQLDDGVRALEPTPFRTSGHLLAPVRGEAQLPEASALDHSAKTPLRARKGSSGTTKKVR